MWDLSSLNRDQTYTCCLGTWGLNCWTASKVPSLPILMLADFDDPDKSAWRWQREFLVMLFQKMVSPQLQTMPVPFDPIGKQGSEGLACCVSPANGMKENNPMYWVWSVIRKTFWPTFHPGALWPRRLCSYFSGGLLALGWFRCGSAWWQADGWVATQLLSSFMNQ